MSDAELIKEATAFIEETTGKKLAEGFGPSLKDGVILCEFCEGVCVCVCHSHCSACPWLNCLFSMLWHSPSLCPWLSEQAQAWILQAGKGQQGMRSVCMCVTPPASCMTYALAMRGVCKHRCHLSAWRTSAHTPAVGRCEVEE
jgi:hypothetical protein